MKTAFLTLDNLISIIRFFSSLVTIFGFPLALKLFLREKRIEQKRNLDKKRHVLLILKSQLSLIAHWASRDDAGYPEHPPPDKIQEWSNPFRLIFKPNESGLRQVPLLEGIIEFKDLYKLAVELNQCIGRMNDLQDQLTLVATSNVHASLRIDKSFSDPNIKLTPDELLLKDKVLGINAVIHCGVIGDGYRDGLKKSFHKLESAVDEELKKLETTPKDSSSDHLLRVTTNLVLVGALLLVLCFFLATTSLFYFLLPTLLVIIALLILYINYYFRGFTKLK